MLVTAGHVTFQPKGETQAQVALVPQRSEERGQILNLLQDNVSFASVAAAATVQAEQGRALSNTPRTASSGSFHRKPFPYRQNLFSIHLFSSSSSTFPSPGRLQPGLQLVCTKES